MKFHNPSYHNNQITNVLNMYIYIMLTYDIKYINCLVNALFNVVSVEYCVITLCLYV